MDSLTHIALGACIGDAILGRKIGKRAMFLGAVSQSIPDIDFIASGWMDTSSSLLAHRGFTHSFLFGILIVFFISMVSEYWFRKHDISLRTWLFFFGIEIVVHLFLDAFNAYGIGWFEPFSNYRVSFNAIFVADPFFSIWPAAAFIALLIMKSANQNRKTWIKWSLLLSGLYLFYCTLNKVKIDRATRAMLNEQHIAYNNYFTTPAPLSNWLWFAVASTDSGYYFGYRSVFDRSKNIQWTFRPRNEYLLGKVNDHEEVQHLLRFSKGFYTLEYSNDTLVFNDLRFGQVTGWYNPEERFVFRYYLSHHDNKLVVQKGRFANWNAKTMKALFLRIIGRQRL